MPKELGTRPTGRQMSWLLLTPAVSATLGWWFVTLPSQWWLVFPLAVIAVVATLLFAAAVYAAAKTRRNDAG